MPDEFKRLLRRLRREVHQLHATWRRLLIVAVIGVLVVILGLAGLGAYFIVGTRHATDKANQAITDVGNQADNQAQALRCIENYENARRERDLLVSRVSTARNRALDARNFAEDSRNVAEDAALNAAITHQPQSKIMRLVRMYSAKARAYHHAVHVYRRATHRYYQTLAAHPMPKLKKFRCAEQAAKRAQHSTLSPTASPSPRPSVSVSISYMPRPAPTVYLPGKTTTAPAPPPSTITTTAPPGKALGHRRHRAHR